MAIVALLLAVSYVVIQVSACVGSNKANAEECCSAPDNYASGEERCSDPKAQEYPLIVHFINVGHGDCALIQCEGHNMIIDGGMPRYGDRVRGYLRRQGVEHLDAVVCSHEHKDHVGGLRTIVHSLSYDKVLRSQRLLCWQ
ncbi:MBL fold metallo-hydrolase [bacterium]|nr:MBL fold metallo-hydrolase [bacterium]